MLHIGDLCPHHHYFSSLYTITNFKKYYLLIELKGTSLTSQICNTKVRCYFTSTQKKGFEVITDGCRLYWNTLTAIFRQYDKDGPNQPFPTPKEMREKYPNLKVFSYKSLESVKMDFDKCLKQWFKSDNKRKGKPKFKKYNVAKQSFRVSTTAFKIKDSILTISKFKGTIKLPKSFDINTLEKVQFVTIQLNSCGQYFVTFNHTKEIKQFKKTGKTVGIDLGLIHIITSSNGEVVENPKYFRKSQAKLKKEQQRLSKCKLGSNNYEKQRLAVAKIHLKVTNQRKHLHHCISKNLVQMYDVICLEDLAISNMIKNRRLSKAFSDTSLASLVTMIEYKAKWHDKLTVKVGRYFPSSKLCSGCGHKMPTMPLSVRSWCCTSCEETHDRDVNVAINIHVEGLFILQTNKS